MKNNLDLYELTKREQAQKNRNEKCEKLFAQMIGFATQIEDESQRVEALKWIEAEYNGRKSAGKVTFKDARGEKVRAKNITAIKKEFVVKFVNRMPAKQMDDSIRTMIEAAKNANGNIIKMSDVA